VTQRLLAVACVWLLLFVTPADALVRIENFVEASFAPNPGGIEVYAYKSGVDNVADFATGTHTATADNAGTLQLDPTSFWWDTDWKQRQCFTINSPAALGAYQARFAVDTSASASDGSDIRVVADTTGPLLTSFSHGPFTDMESLVFARIEPLPAGTSTYCVYFDNPTAASISNETATFAAMPGQLLNYYTMLPSYAGGALNRQVSVIAYTANTTVSDGTTSVTLGAGGTAIFTNVGPNTVITADGPIEAQFDRPSKETLIPETFADSQFSFATSRYFERFYVRAPFAPTTIEAIANGVVVASVLVTPAMGTVTINPAAAAPTQGGTYVTLRSTDGTDFIAVQSATNGGDILVGVPWYGDTLYGVASTRLTLAAPAPTTVSWIRDNGGANPAQPIATNTLTFVAGNGALGNGAAYAITGGTYFAAAQQADGNGRESSAFLPERLLSATYRLPIRADYIAVACPVVGTMVSLNGGAPTVCAGTGVGRWYSGFGNFAPGTTVTADQPIYAYIQARISNDEHNLLGLKASIPRVPGLTVTAGAVENLGPFCGSWTSNAYATGGVFGLADFAATAPPGTTATFQISTDGSGFYGPDGTAATSFADGSIVPYAADNVASLVLQLELCTSDATVTPSVTLASIESALPELVLDVSNRAPVSVDSSSVAVTQNILRVYQAQAGAWSGAVDYRSGTNLAALNATFSTDHPSVQVTAAAGVIAAPGPAFVHSPTMPYSVAVTHDKTPGPNSTVEIVLVDTLGVRLEAGVVVTFTG